MGFVSKRRKNKFYTFVYRKNSQPFECNLTKIGLEKDFYGNPSESEADGNITESESAYVIFLKTLRGVNNNTTLQPKECADFLSHMYIIGKSIRSSIQEIGTTFYAAAKEKIAQFPDQKSFFLHLIKKNRKELAEEIMAKLPATLSNHQKVILTKHCLDNPNEWLAQISENDLTEITGAFDRVIKDIPRISKESHNQALKEKTTSKGITKKLIAFQWQLFYQTENSYILGDVGPICWNTKEEKFKKLMFINKEINSIFMPISKHHLLVGQIKSNFKAIPNSCVINQAIARLSREFFISSTNSNDTKELAFLIGKEGNLVGDNEKAILEKTLNPLIS